VSRGYSSELSANRAIFICPCAGSARAELGSLFLGGAVELEQLVLPRKFRNTVNSGELARSRLVPLQRIEHLLDGGYRCRIASRIDSPRSPDRGDTGTQVAYSCRELSLRLEIRTGRRLPFGHGGRNPRGRSRGLLLRNAHILEVIPSSPQLGTTRRHCVSPIAGRSYIWFSRRYLTAVARHNLDRCDRRAVLAAGILGFAVSKFAHAQIKLLLLRRSASRRGLEAGTMLSPPIENKLII
jgi:hypothetical protein